MYYITNQENQIIAFDANLLKMLGVKDTMDFYAHLALNKITLNHQTPDRLTISTLTDEYSYTLEATVLHSILGVLTLHMMMPAQVTEADKELFAIDETIATQESIEEMITFVHEPESLDIENEENLIIESATSTTELKESLSLESQESIVLMDETTKEDDSLFIDNTPQDDEVSIAFMDEPTTHSIQVEESLLISDTPITLQVETKPQEDEAPITLMDEPTTHSIQVEESLLISDTPITLQVETKPQEDEAPITLMDEPVTIVTQKQSSVSDEDKDEEITIDIQTLSDEMGVSREDYLGFLHDFKETVEQSKTQLYNTRHPEHRDAIEAIESLAEVMGLTIIIDQIEALFVVSGDALEMQVDALIQTINKVIAKASLPIQETISLSEELAPIAIEETLSLMQEQTITPTEPLKVFEQHPVVQEDMILTTEDDEPLLVEDKSAIITESVEPLFEIQEEKVETPIKKSTSMLDNVKPIHFDFRLEEASNELGLPVELIDEFVHDFIEQAHENTLEMLEAYDVKDLARIQKLGHLLKGASSNLRINPLAETLYEIQFCEDFNKVEGLIKNYWGHFIAFETQINMTSKK